MNDCQRSVAVETMISAAPIVLELTQLNYARLIVWHGIVSVVAKRIETMMYTM